MTVLALVAIGIPIAAYALVDRFYANTPLRAERPRFSSSDRRTEVFDPLINLAWLLALTAAGGAGYLWWLASRIEPDAPSRD